MRVKAPPVPGEVRSDTFGLPHSNIIIQLLLLYSAYSITRKTAHPWTNVQADSARTGDTADAEGCASISHLQQSVWKHLDTVVYLYIQTQSSLSLAFLHFRLVNISSKHIDVLKARGVSCVSHG